MMRVENLAHHHSTPDRNGEASSYCDGTITIDKANHRLLAKDGTTNLTPMEFRLLMRFVQEPDRCLPARDLALALWNDATAGHEKLIKVYVHRLRRKFRHCLPGDRYIINRRAIGYRFH
jgi:DNA-binding response OmpR family regulator